MAKYFQRWVLTGAVAIVILAGFVDLTSPGDEITTETFTNAELGKGLILSNQETQELQRDFVADSESQEIPNRSVVSLGFIYPQFAVRNRDELEIGILEDRPQFDQPAQRQGQGDRPAHRDMTYVWLLEWERLRRLPRTRATASSTRWTPGAAPRGCTTTGRALRLDAHRPRSRAIRRIRRGAHGPVTATGDTEVDQQFLAYQYSDSEKYLIRVETHRRYSEAPGDTSPRWVLDRLARAGGCLLLDVGCGPGIYHRRWHTAGSALARVDCIARHGARGATTAAREGLR